jgi:hypothetical protein
VAGDFHQHTTYTDGKNSFATLMFKNHQFGLDWWANSEHGGRFPLNARGPLSKGGPFDVDGGYPWTDTAHYPTNPIVESDGINMWRWQSLRDYSFEDTLQARLVYQKPVFQGLEWNVPGHEHASMGLIAGQFGAMPNAAALAEFEYLFDGRDTDLAGGLAQGWTDKNTVNDHAKAVQAVTWLQQNYDDASYVVFAHPERKGPADPTYVGSGSHGYDIRDFRDFNTAAPDVCFGFESFPGHQKAGTRGGYGSGAVDGATFGGVGAYSAKIGGLWDAMLGEGRHWWLFASSDFHNTVGDFWPGEYQKTHTYVADRQSPQAILDGLRSGNSFVVSGDLINALEFDAQYDSSKATMGETLPVAPERESRNPVRITIRFRSPALNHNADPVVVDHVDLISGDITGVVPPTSPDYNNPTNPTAGVMARFTAADWVVDADGWHVIRYDLRIDHDMYFRLRGTNLPVGTENELDDDGNPLPDSLVGPNTADKAWTDLWFYSNPVFVRVRR